MVILFHLFQWFNAGFGSLGAFAFIRNGWAGVELFVVLSGYLIYGAVCSAGNGRVALIKYAKRRALRIYPVYFVAALAGITLIYFGITPFTWHQDRLASITKLPDHVWLVFYELLLLRAVAWPLAEIVNPPAWSLGVEISFYCLIPLYALRTRRRPLFWGGVAFLLLFMLKGYGPREFGIFVFFWVGILVYEIERLEMIRLYPEWVWRAMLMFSLVLIIYFMQGEWVGMAGNHMYPRHYKTGYLVVGYGMFLLSIS